MSESSLIPIEQKIIVFRGDEITAVVVETDEGRTVYLPLRMLCDHLGISYNGQRERIARDPVLSEIVQGVRVTRSPSADGRGGGPQKMECIPLEFLNGWLFGVSASRVKEELREKLVAYQRHCYLVLSREFSFAAAAPQGGGTESVLGYVREMGLAIARLAEEQMRYGETLGELESVSHETAVVVNALALRVERLEERTGGSGKFLAVTDDQASQVSQAVKAIAIALGKQTGRNEFGGVYGEMYRKFGISSYKLLPASRFDAVMAWLNEWYQSLVGDTPF